jgi:hypothetical protein
MLDYLFWLTEYSGYYPIIFIVIAYIAYYLLSNTFMFLIFLIAGIIIGMYLSYYIKNYINI